ncbi:hypothetical protein VTL71DRAFT_10048 [Oculimacula yallundae]|uniref:Heterokaryon incompatibility domain-containing protein n=1 Tax=Oculimacula yallundae TaxID=86028 RepID=A0ABR4BQ67_9HELO
MKNKYRARDLDERFRDEKDKQTPFLVGIDHEVKELPRCRTMLVYFGNSFGRKPDSHDDSIGQILMLDWIAGRGPIEHDVEHQYTGADANIALAREWLRTCQETHGECVQYSRSRVGLPSRLVEIQMTGGELLLRLCPRENFPAHVSYATVSHCWGDYEFLKLSRKNLTFFQVNIPISGLTKTFQDAVGVAYGLGFQYIWIDSLCIIQDDNQDWSKEAPRMATVYGGSSLNIAATGARDGRDGLFFNRDQTISLSQKPLVKAKANMLFSPSMAPSSFVFPRAECNESSDTDTTLSDSKRVRLWLAILAHSKAYLQEESLLREQQLFYCIDSDLYKRSLASQSLLSRAWVFQERILAPRTLHFGTHQIAWECQNQTCFETFPNGIPDELFGDEDILRGMPMVQAKARGFEASWKRIVSVYSQCVLTNTSDKLMAIAGVAESFTEKYHGSYIWGLWRDHLPRALLWRIFGHATRSPLRSPSWSWIGIDGCVELYDAHDSEDKDICTVIGTHADGSKVNWVLTIKCERLIDATDADYSNPEEVLIPHPTSPGQTVRASHVDFDVGSSDDLTSENSLGAKLPIFILCVEDNPKRAEILVHVMGNCGSTRACARETLNEDTRTCSLSYFTSPGQLVISDHSTSRLLSPFPQNQGRQWNSSSFPLMRDLRRIVEAPFLEDRLLKEIQGGRNHVVCVQSGALFFSTLLCTSDRILTLESP